MASSSKDRVAMLDGHLGKTTVGWELIGSVRSITLKLDCNTQPAVTLQRRGCAGIVSLNRPKALNSLNQEMIDLLQPALRACENDPACKIIILRGEGRAFCAGGDVVDLATAARYPDKRHKSVNLFKGEYETDRYIAHLRKPFISLLHGITMGGGAGLSVHGSFRVATEKTVFAMPETGIGLFPDVGANFFLPRMDGQLGTYIALTSERLTGYAVYQARIATHFIPSTQIQNLLENLISLQLEGKDAKAISEAVDKCIESLATEDDKGTKSTLIGEKRKAIDECFKYDRMEEILDALKKYEQKNGGELGEWAKETIKTIELKSPTSLKVTLEGIRRGKNMGINQVLQMDMEIGEMFCNADIVPDFAEGVTHLLVNKRKDRAAWNPATLESTPDSQILDIFFNPSNRKYTQLNPPEEEHMTNDYTEYPHANFGLPAEEKIVGVAVDKNWKKEEIVRWAKEKCGDKVGLVEHVDEVLSRRG